MKWKAAGGFLADNRGRKLEKLRRVADDFRTSLTKSVLTCAFLQRHDASAIARRKSWTWTAKPKHADV